MNENQKLIYIVLIVLCAAVGIYFIVPKADAAIKAYQEVQTKTIELDKIKKDIEDLKNKKAAYEKKKKFQQNLFIKAK